MRHPSVDPSPDPTPSEVYWRHFRRITPWGIAASLITLFPFISLSGLSALASGGLSAASATILLMAGIGVFVMLRHWRRRSRLQHYATWILCVAAVTLPVLGGIYLLARLVTSDPAEVSVAPAYMVLVSIILGGLIFGSIHESIERALDRARKDIDSFLERTGSS